MKKAAFIYLCLIAGILSSCTKDSKYFTIGVDVQSSFNGEKVQVFIDGQALISKQLQTNQILGVCYIDGQITATKTTGKHEIKTIIDNTVSKTESFTLDANLYIGVNYNPQIKTVSFIYSKQPFVYD